LLKQIFSKITQQQIKKINKNILKELIKINNILSTKKPKQKLTIIHRARLEKAFNKKPKRYLWKEYETTLTAKRFKKFRDFIVKNIEFKNKKELSDWIDWIIKNKIQWDDSFYNNIKNDIQININITNYNSKNNPDIELLIIGSKDYDKIIKKAIKILK
jgi:hypothetical protein